VRTFVVMLVAAAAGVAGYVLGARAGRGRYREIKETAESFWNDPAVKKARKKAAKKLHDQAMRAVR
jgi:hypothetical protein